MRLVIVSILLAAATSADAADDPDIHARDPRYRLEALDDRASGAGGICLEVTARAARPLPPDRLARLREVTGNRVVDANPPADRGRYVEYADGVEGLVGECTRLAGDFSGLGATAEEEHCRRRAQVWAERPAALRRAIAETDAEQRRIAGEPERHPDPSPVGDVGRGTSPIPRSKGPVRELVAGPNLLFRMQGDLLGRSAPPLWVIGVAIPIGRARTRARTPRGKLEKRRDQEARGARAEADSRREVDAFYRAVERPR